MKKHLYLAILIFGFMSHTFAQEHKKKSDVSHEFELELEGEYRYFWDKAKFQSQENHFPSLAIKPQYSMEWNRGYESINIEAFYRLDRDSKRTHADIREFYYQKAKGNWELSLGLKKVYWGVAESNHLVDIINQTDAVESFDGEEKLGQPMLQFSWNSSNFGTIDFFYLPYHRKRSFSGNKGRLRFGNVIDKDEVGYESAAKEWRQDIAVRWKHYINAFDIGLSHFYGNGREPYFSFDEMGNMTAFYPVINQTGLDLQITHDAFLWKLESIYRTADQQDFYAMVAGVEYTFSNIDGNGLDIGLLAEYLYDERDELTLSGMQNDIFLGSRIAFNDIQDASILFGLISDLESKSRIFSVEASRRFGTSWTAELEARFFSNISKEEQILSNFEKDSFLRLKISKFF